MANSLKGNTVYDRLIAKVRDLGEAECLVIETLIDSLGLTVENYADPNSDIVTPKFARYFRTRLQIHHATTKEKFKKKSFEYAFQEACRACGLEAQITPSGTNPGHDVTVDGIHYSLKTEASRGINEKQITISKFMEARWIRECRTGGDFCRGCRRISEHLTHYHRVLILRAFSVLAPQEAVRYDLVEIPHGLLEAVKALTPQDFRPRTRNGGSGATVRSRDGASFRLRLDGSVEKVTLSGIMIADCVPHASWTVPIQIQDENEE